jgi:TRAP-type C4-dicarboxylate transport system substrate-binding protein
MTGNANKTSILKDTLKVVAVASIAFAAPAPVFAETVWKLAFKDNLDGAEGTALTKFAELVDEYSGGELKLQLFPSEQLGKAQASLELLSAGAVDIYAEGMGYLEKWSPELTWLSSSFLFEDREHYMRFLNSDYVSGLVDVATSEANITVLEPRGAMLRGPYRVLVTTEKVEGLDDLSDLRLRMWDQQLIVDIWSHLGAEIRVLGWTDVYPSIQTGIVDGVTSPVAAVETFKFTEVAPHIARTDEFPQSLDIMVNSNSLAALDEDTRAALLRAYKEASEFSHTYTNGLVDDSLGRLTSAGATYTELDIAPWVERMSTFYSEKAASGEMPQAFLDAIQSAR